MTIFRFSRIVPIAALAAAFPAGAASQDTTAAGARPAVHVVQRGETLWDLAQQYYRDPFLWPEIYRLNTLVVEDPHWIFPGEELQLSSLEAMARGGPRPVPPRARPAAPSAPPSDEVPTVFQRQPRESGFRGSRTTSAAYRHRAIRPGEFYSAGFLTEEEQLPWARVLGAVGTPTLKNLTASSSARVFDEIALEAPGGATYVVGDSLLVARLAREVSGWGHVVKPTGLARVTAVAGAQVRAEIVTQFGRVADGQRALPVEPFLNPGDVMPLPVDNGIMGEIVATRDVSPVPGRQLGVVFIDLGRAHGVGLGDEFAVFEARGTEEPNEGRTDPVGVIQIVHVRDRSASGLIIRVYDLGIAAGSAVRLTRKMPS